MFLLGSVSFLEEPFHGSSSGEKRCERFPSREGQKLKCRLRDISLMFPVLLKIFQICSPWRCCQEVCSSIQHGGFSSGFHTLNMLISGSTSYPQAAIKSNRCLFLDQCGSWTVNQCHSRTDPVQTIPVL
ncbi:hypothetical protein XENOCAPTIV_023741 [Xenoophorus captivus]|uniref:Uncharacterized protein n=1 Tax=Xenoophorus captivus TaxID=1517983 RepID=A0ABV0R1T2_9TELE